MKAVFAAAAGAASIFNSSHPTPYEQNFNIPRPAVVEHIPASQNHVKEFEAFAKQQRLIISTFNVLNLNYHVGSYKPDPTTGVRHQVEPIAEKNPKARELTARTIRELGSDIILLQEVESKEDLVRFLTEYKDIIGREYHPLLIEGNDGRGIDVAFLVRKDMGMEFDYVSHKNLAWKNELYPDRTKVFSRDATALIARKPGTEKPLFVLLNTHSKSKRTEIESDEESYLIREGQGHALTDLKLHYEKLYPGVPIMMGGDFNNNPNTAPEYIPLRNQGGMKDAFDLIAAPLSPNDDDRITHTYHPQDPDTHRELPAHKDQMDALMMNGVAAPWVMDAKVQKYYDEFTGNYYPSPDHFWQRKKQPSDHRPVKVTLDWQGLLSIWRGN